MKFYHIPIYILLLIAGPRVFAQYQTFSLSWNTNAYDKLMYISGNDTMPYRLLKPNNYDPTKKYPLVLMLHGQGEGIGEPCTDKNGINICNLGWGGKMHLDSLNKYPAFYLFPQTTHGYWSTSTTYTGAINRPLRLVTQIMTQIINTYSIDLNRIYGHGLCAGGRGIWELSGRYPGLFAAISPHVSADNPNNVLLYVDTPLWGVQGEFDNDPDPNWAIKMYQALDKNGRPTIYTLNSATGKQVWPDPTKTNGRPLYSFFPMVGHEAWPKLYNSPSWLAWMFNQNRLNITVYGNTNIKSGESVKLEMAAGFDAYEWSTGATSRSITVSQPGSYRVRVKRKSSFFSGTSAFTEFSPAVVVTLNGVVDNEKPSSPSNLISTGQTISSISLKWDPATDNIGVDHYNVLMNNTIIASTNLTSYTATNLFPGTSYGFKIVAVDAQGNNSDQSFLLTIATVNTAFGLTYFYYEGNWQTLPDFPNMVAKKTGYITNFTLGPQERTEFFGFRYDGFINIPATGNYTFYTNSDDGSKLYIDDAQIVNNDGLHGAQEKSGTVSNLVKGLHKIRVTFFQNQGGQGLNVQFAGPGISKRIIPDTSLYLKNINDTENPTTPTNLISTGKTATTVDLTWNASTDNMVVTGYQIYVNGENKAFSTTNSYTVSNLNQGTAYTFSVRARDAAMNLSDYSNEITVTTNTSVNGVNYSYYEGTFTAVPNFNVVTPVKTGIVPNYTLTPRNNTDKYSFRFTSFIQINSAGNYTFYTNSNDGSKLLIDGILVVYNDGVHTAQERSGSINLSVGKHAIEVGYIQNGGSELLTVSYAGPGVTKQAIPNNVLFLTNAAPKMAHGQESTEDVGEFKKESNPVTSLTAYPNPFENQLLVTINSGNEGLLKVYNSFGDLILQRDVLSGEHYLDFSNFPKGFYFIKIYSPNEKETQTLRVVKN